MREILACMAPGLSAPAIAGELCFSTTTATPHRHNLYVEQTHPCGSCRIRTATP